MGPGTPVPGLLQILEEALARPTHTPAPRLSHCLKKALGRHKGGGGAHERKMTPSASLLPEELWKSKDESLEIIVQTTCKELAGRAS